MIKLALIGKNIAHSKSPTLYKELLFNKYEVQYYLLDYQSEFDIPNLTELFVRYDLSGLSVTAPYKKHFIKELHLNENSIINTIKRTPNGYSAINTDQLAVEEILKNLVNKHGALSVIILGDGSMSKITQETLGSLNLNYQVLSRRTHDNFEKIDLGKYTSESQTNLIINSCSRDYFFRGNLPTNTIFWDYNYGLEEMKKYILGQVGVEYIDGQDMLRRQAIHALQFWGLKY